MKVLATVLLGPGTDATVGDAIRSSNGLVDGFLLIESGGGWPAIKAAREAVQAPAEELRLDWAESYERGGYGAGRQFALEQARLNGADYALTLDPDERIVDAAAIRYQLEQHPEHEVYLARDKDTLYYKERVIRCSAPISWHGRVCEYTMGLTRVQAKLSAKFWELPKDEAGHRRRHERGIVECQRMIDEGDDCFRWRRHMGGCLMALERRDEAIAQYRKAHSMAVADEDKAWVWYLLCEQLVLDGKYSEAMSDAARGFVDHAGFLPEYAWVIAYCQLQVGNHQNALRWAQLGAQCPDDKTRIGFRGTNARTGCREILTALLAAKKDEPQFTAETFKYREQFAQNYGELAAALVDVLKPSSHRDLGAGQGLLVEAMGKLGVDSTGVELEASAQEVCPAEIRDRISFGRSFLDSEARAKADMVSSVEVLEHLSPELADAAVRSIADSSTRWVYFSAAAPGQPGKGHVNCQPKPYWRAKFQAAGFRFAETHTALLVDRIKGMQPCSWLPQNAMIFERTSNA